MAGDALQDLLARFGSGAPVRCSCGREHRLALRHLITGEGALARSAALLREAYGAAPALWVLSDENTEAAAGDRWKVAVGSSRITSRILPGRPRPVPTLALVDQLSTEVRAGTPDLLVGVGSGVISDLVKKLSLDTGVPSWCVATAPSVDAYGSAASALRAAGAHRAFPARPSEVVVCDLEVLSDAPRPLFLAGLGDLLAKFLASLDWRVAQLVTGEQRCEPLAGFALDSARAAVEAARTARTNPVEAVRALADAGMVSGLAMQAFGSSRPAASAEHTIAHFWEAAGAVGSGDQGLDDLHGLLAGAASRVVLGGYADWYRGLAGPTPDVAARLAAFDREPPWAVNLEDGLRPFQQAIAEELRGRALDRAALARHLEAFDREREAILATAAPLLGELGRAVDVIAELGFPFDLDALGIAPPLRLLPVRNVRLLRARYTTFDLAYELGREDELVAAIARGG
jgi:glycerol-1-phosphate dehydrogenase [NAD(P)+]